MPHSRGTFATERHYELAELLTRIGDRMNQLANRIDIQSSFLGSFVFLQMGETAKAHALADSGRNVLVVSNNNMKDGGEVDDDDVEEVEIEEDKDDDDQEGNDGVEKEKENRNENKNESQKKGISKEEKENLL